MLSDDDLTVCSLLDPRPPSVTHSLITMTGIHIELQATDFSEISKDASKSCLKIQVGMWTRAKAFSHGEGSPTLNAAVRVPWIFLPVSLLIARSSSLGGKEARRRQLTKQSFVLVPPSPLSTRSLSRQTIQSRMIE